MPAKWSAGRTRWAIIIPGQKRPLRPEHKLLVLGTLPYYRSEYWKATVGAVEGVRIMHDIATTRVWNEYLHLFDFENTGTLEVWWTPTLTILSRLKGRSSTPLIRKEQHPWKAERLLKTTLIQMDQKTTPQKSLKLEQLRSSLTKSRHSPRS